MYEDEVLAARFAHDSGIGLIAREIGADLPPEVVEGRRRAGEVEAAQVGTRRYHLAHQAPLAGDEVHHAIGQARLAEYLHYEIIGVEGGGRRLPYRRIAHQHGRHVEVGSDGRKVERREGEHETLQGPVFHAVDDSFFRTGLVGIDISREEVVEAQEIHQFARGVYFGLERIFTLAEHHRGIDEVTIFRGDEFRRTLQEGGAFHPRHPGPLAVGLHGSLYRHPHLLLSGLVIGSEYMSVVVRHHHFAGIARAYLAAADNERYLPLLGCEPVECLFKVRLLLRTGSVSLHRFVARLLKFE